MRPARTERRFAAVALIYLAAAFIVHGLAFIVALLESGGIAD
jgi:hypothetical protein